MDEADTIRPAGGYDELAQADPAAGRAQGWVSRLLRSEGGPVTVPFGLAVAGAAAYGGALALDWVTVVTKIAVYEGSRPAATQILQLSSGEIRFSDSGSTEVTYAASNNLTTVDNLGLLFGLGGLLLLTLCVGVLSRPDLAARYRLAASGLGLGLVGIMVAAVNRLPSLLIAAEQSGSVGSASADATVSYGAGLLCAFAAAVLPVVAIWIRAGRPGSAGPVAAGSAAPARYAVAPRARRVAATTVPAPEPYDLAVTPEP